MRTYNPIHWLERIKLHDIFTDERFWASVVILGFIALFALLVVISGKTGGM